MPRTKFGMSDLRSGHQVRNGLGFSEIQKYKPIVQNHKLACHLNDRTLFRIPDLTAVIVFHTKSGANLSKRF